MSSYWNTAASPPNHPALTATSANFTLPETLDELLGRLNAATNEGIRKAAELAESVSTPLLEAWDENVSGKPAKGHRHKEGFVSRVTDQIERKAALLRWQSELLGSHQRLPQPTQIDQRLMLAVAGLGHVVYQQVLLRHGQPAQPVTMTLIATTIAVFFTPDGVLLREVCLSPFCVIEQHQYKRLITSAFVHVDGTHLCSNLAAVIPDALDLEQHLGSARMLLELPILTVVAHGMYVGFEWLQKTRGSRRAYYSVGGLGMSSVVFGLQVMAGELCGDSKVNILGLPSRYSWVLQIVLTHALLPRACFPAHMCGVLAGVLQAYIISPVLDLLLGPPASHRLSPAAAASPSQPPADGARTWGAGTTSGRPLERDSHLNSNSDSNAAGSSMRRSSRYKNRRNLLQLVFRMAVQLGLAAGVSAAYVAMNRRTTVAAAGRGPAGNGGWHVNL